MRLWWMPVFLFACESVTPSGDLLSPVAPPAPAPVVTPPVPGTPPSEPAAGPAAAEAAPAQPGGWDFPEEEFSISSEEMQANATAAEAAAAPAAAPAPEAAPQPSASAGAPSAMAFGAGWPLRLVSTVAQAQPPRAILGLPDGREVVVSPGSLLPEVGLVVLSVGPRSVEAARVVANGDHAVVNPITLSSQY